MHALVPWLAGVLFATGGDSISYPTLANRGIGDCPVSHSRLGTTTGTERPTVCRVARATTAAEVRAHLAAGEQLWRRGDELNFAWRGEAQSVELLGLGVPMGRLVGTDLWVLTLRAGSLDRAIVRYAFMPMPGDGTHRSMPARSTWRGRRAPALPPRSAAVHGRLVSDSISSAALGVRRALTIYVPPMRRGERVAGVIYMADGQSIAAFAAMLDTLIVTRAAPPLLLVGLHSDPTPMTAIPGQAGRYEPDGRSREYLPGVDSARFAAHERFFVDEVLPYAEREFGAPAAPGRRVTFGFSNGATFAGSMALRHPDRFGSGIVLSPGGGPRSFAAIGPASLASTTSPPLTLYLSGGMLEPVFRANARALAMQATARGAVVTLREPAGGHDEAVWNIEFLNAVKRLFGTARSPGR
jgi:enterochelin esterase-like enzyme